MSDLCSDSAPQSHIAVIGLSCRLPGANDPAAFWRNLQEGREAISFFSDKELLRSGVAASLLSDPRYVRAGAVLSDIEMFDAAFFGFSPREAAILDPQHRLFLECAWEALEDAGYNPEVDKGLCGVFAGAGINTYLLHNLHGHKHLLASIGGYQMMLANDKDYLATRVSYKLNLKGPSITIQTACSSSLAAVHLACQSLLTGDCDVAMAGGVSVRVPHHTGYLHEEGMILSPDGHCRAFDADAMGTVGGNGAGVVVLKRLKDALMQGDNIRAVIRGSAINNDGSLKAGYTAPSVEGQAAAVSEAMAVAAVEPETVTYIEAHGTGTPVGDPIELTALRKVFGADCETGPFCALGSVKTNIGHLDAAAGIAGLIKTVLALENKQIPPSLHFERPNPAIKLTNSPFHVNSRLSPWTSGKTPRRAGVSSFGIGGTNVHAVIEEAPARRVSRGSRPCQLLIMSAKSAPALVAGSDRMAKFLKEHPESCLADVAQTLSRRRTDFPYRRVVVCQNTADAVAALESGSEMIQPQPPTTMPVVFMFPGQGSQHVNMGFELYKSEPTFRECVDYCSGILQRQLSLDLRDILHPREGTESKAAEFLSQTSLTQPAIFVIEYALAMLWIEWGVKPRHMIGHSLGEYVAACLAGVFSLEDCLGLVATRARMMDQMPSGSMLAVPLPRERVEQLLNHHISIAAVNTPSQCVVSGDRDSIKILYEQLNLQNVKCSWLKTSHAFHSDMFDPIVESFATAVGAVQRRRPEIPYISNLTGTWISASEATDPQYWARHLRGPVQFADGLRTLLAGGRQFFLEVGPGHALGDLTKQVAASQDDAVISFSMRHRNDRRHEEAILLDSLGRAWLNGVQVDWSGVYKHQLRNHIPLPTYPFDRQRYWIDPPGCDVALDPDIAADDASSFYVPSWTRTIDPLSRLVNLSVPANCLLFIDELGYGTAMAAQLRNWGANVTTVTPGNHFARLENGTYSLNPSDRDDYYALVRELRVHDGLPECVAHMWNLTSVGEGQPDVKCADHANRFGFYSLLFLVQALGDLGLPNPVALSVFSNFVHDVTGREPLQPQKATLLGPIAVIPQEHAKLTCKNIDLDVAEEGVSDNRLARQMLAELTGEYSDPVVCYRGRHRWVQTFVPTQLDPTIRPVIRDRGVYVIVGGTGGIGLALAELLAKSVKSPAIALIGRAGASNDWQQRELTPSRYGSASNGRRDEPTGFDLKSHAELFASIEQRLRSSENTRSDISSLGLQQLLDELCASYICDYFRRSDIRIKKGMKYSRKDLLRELRALPKFEKFLDFFVRILKEDSIISIQDGEVVFRRDSTEIRSPDVISREAIEKLPDVSCLVNLLKHCSDHYGPALAGDIEGIGVLYPDGALSPLLLAVEEHGDKFNSRHVPINLLGEILLRIAQECRGKRLKILEIGAGNGELTWRLVERLKHIDVEYTVTDLDKSFVLQLEKRSSEAGLDFMRFGVLDIYRDPLEQDYEESGFDVIIGLDVVHATPLIKRTLLNLQSLLASDGVLCLLETVKNRRWTDMVFGLADDWWYFEDYELRTSSPLIGIRKWVEVLEAQGYRDVQAYPQSERQWDAAEFGLLVAQNHAAHNLTRRLPIAAMASSSADDRLRAIDKLRELGARVAVLTADVSDVEQTRSALAAVREEFGPVRGVIHAAGTLGGGTIQIKIQDDVEQEFSAKVKGTLVLNSLLKDDALDFFVLCSSYTSVAGGFGQVGYSAANAFLDAFARYKASGATDTFITSIAWDRWRNVGMAVHVEALYEQITHETLTGGLSRDEGMEAFRRILSLGAHPNITVYKGDFESLLRSSRSYQAQRFEAQLPALPLHSRPNVRNNYFPATTSTEVSLAGIWQEELGIRQVGVHDNFTELGGDSLIAIRLISRIRQALGVELRVRALYDSPTIAELAEHVETIRWAGQPESAGVAAIREDEEGGSL
jgi:acyl transferase domain-containing protein/acyl carrier protein/SAM-dependent methyltransferase